MHGIELSQLAITPAATDDDLAAMIHVRRLVTPEARPTVVNLRANLDLTPDLVYLVARLGGEPVACGFVEPHGPYAQGDIAVVPDWRCRGIGSAMLAELSAKARALGRDEAQGEVKESDLDSRAFLERRGFVQVGAEKAVALELDGIQPPQIDPPEGVRTVSRADEPDHLDGMYAVAVQADEDIRGVPRPDRDPAGLAPARGRHYAQARADRRGQARRLQAPPYGERGAQRADAPAQREARVRRGARLQHGRDAGAARVALGRRAYFGL